MSRITTIMMINKYCVMGNYKNMLVFIESLIKRGKPFLLIKYGITFFDVANNCYEVVTMGSKGLNYAPIERSEAIRAIDKFNLPLLHQIDSRNAIWGDEKFKEKYEQNKSSVTTNILV